MEPFATIQDLTQLWRALKPEENERAGALLEIVSDSLRVEANKVGRDLDKMIEENKSYANVVKSVVIDVTQQGTFLVPGGGLFIKKSELARLGLRTQRYGVIDFYGNVKRDNDNAN